MDTTKLTGLWRLVEARAWDGDGAPLPPPYGRHPVGQITITAQGRMLAALCNGDPEAPPGRGYSSYGGPFTLDGDRLVTTVDMASDPARIGGEQVREVRFEGEDLVLRPPLRAYGGVPQQRELRWERVWRPDN